MIISPETEKILEIKDLSFSYDKNVKHPIINNLNFSVHKHEIMAIVGPNGAGKTTLLKLLVGLLKPIHGHLLLNDKEVKNTKQLLQAVGIVFQNPDEQVFFPKVEDDIAFGLENLELKPEDIQEKVHQVMHKLKITYLNGRSFFSLSFGEKKKVSLAGVLVTRPEVILFDEPTIGLDPWSRQEFINILKDLRQESTLLIVSHDEELLKEAQKIHFLWEGTFIHSFTNFIDFKTFLPNFQIKRE